MSSAGGGCLVYASAHTHLKQGHTESPAEIHTVLREKGFWLRIFEWKEKGLKQRQKQFQIHLDYHRDQQVAYSILEAPDDAKQIRHGTASVVVVVIIITITVSSRKWWGSAIPPQLSPVWGMQYWTLISDSCLPWQVVNWPLHQLYSCQNHHFCSEKMACCCSWSSSSCGSNFKPPENQESSGRKSCLWYNKWSIVLFKFLCSFLSILKLNKNCLEILCEFCTSDFLLWLQIPQKPPPTQNAHVSQNQN